MTRTLVRPADEARQRVVGARMAEKWNCTVHHFPRYAAVDIYMQREGRVVAVAEVKCRDVETGTYASVYLSLLKWRALMLLASAFSCAGLFVVSFRDGVRWVDVRSVDDIETIYAGRTDRADVDTDMEWIIPVPMARMGVL